MLTNVHELGECSNFRTAKEITMTETTERVGETFTEILARDSRPVPERLAVESPMAPGNTRVPPHVYFSQEFHDLEVERLWSRVWQLACLADEIPDVGDYYVYDIAHLSFLIVRTESGGLKAYRNACLHRGRQLRHTHGRGATSLRCAFHGWKWNLDGELKEIPAQWDFPSVDLSEYCLDEALVDTWHGLVFINPDRSAPPLAEYLVGLENHFEVLPFERRQKVCHVEKIMPVNWKACQEAFMESYHVIATHPTLVTSLGDSNSRYDVYGNFSRAISAQEVASPHLHDMPHRAQHADGRHFSKFVHPLSGHTYERLDLDLVQVTDLDGTTGTFAADGGWIEGAITQADPHLCTWVGGPLFPGMEDLGILFPTVPAGEEPRAYVAEQRRAAYRAKYGDLIDVDTVCDAELIDSIYFSVFPNWSPWGVFSELMYRFRPHGDNPEECIFDVMRWVPYPNTNGRAQHASVTRLGVDDDWSLAPELGAVMKVFQQDSINLSKVQRGIKSLDRSGTVLASYNESKIRHFYELLYDALDLGEVQVEVGPRTIG